MRNLTNLLPRRRPGRARPYLRGQRLQLESLEQRDLPSAVFLSQARPDAAPTPSIPLTPSQVRHAYGFDQVTFSAGGKAVAADGTGQTIAVVDAYDDPNVWSDLQTFDRNFGLPDPPAFVKAMPQGRPAPDAGWAGEIALDVEWAHAIAPKANLLLVEARSAGDRDLLGAVDYARRQPGVVAVSMSWGGGEFWGEAALDGYFTTPAGHVGGSGLAGGVTFVASSGDGGAWNGPEWPASSPNVLAVGGTTLATAAGTYQGETGWAGSGGGYSLFEFEPTFQKGAQTSGARTTPDVAYDADPDTGFLVYVSVPNAAGQAGWFSYGGTSAGAPQWAALIALADQGRALAGKGSLANVQSLVYGLPAADFHDVTHGNNGYTAHAGYDLVTGRGSPYADRIITALLTVSGSATTNAVGGSPSAGNSPRTGLFVTAAQVETAGFGMNAGAAMTPAAAGGPSSHADGAATLPIACPPPALGTPGPGTSGNTGGGEEAGRLALDRGGDPDLAFWQMQSDWDSLS